MAAGTDMLLDMPFFFFLSQATLLVTGNSLKLALSHTAKHAVLVLINH